MDRLAHHFVTMAYNNAWANHRLLRAVEQLSQDEFVAPRTGFFPSIVATLNHNVTVDWLYVDALERGLRGDAPNPKPGSFFTPQQPFDACSVLRAAQRQVDRRLLDLCQALTVERLETPIGIVRAAGVMHDSASRILAHLFQHQIHHRGQAHAMLAGTSVKPPQLDEFFCANEAHLRADDFAELGFDEDAIWNPRA